MKRATGTRQMMKRTTVFFTAVKMNPISPCPRAYVEVFTIVSAFLRLNSGHSSMGSLIDSRSDENEMEPLEKAVSLFRSVGEPFPPEARSSQRKIRSRPLGPRKGRTDGPQRVRGAAGEGQMRDTAEEADVFVQEVATTAARSPPAGFSEQRKNALGGVSARFEAA